jgi:hypothetical protein
MSSVTIGGTAFRVRPWPRPKIKRAIQWKRAANGNVYGSDRGASQDIYTTEVSFLDTEDKINSISNILNSNKDTVTLSAFNVDIFAPNIDHTGSITCAYEVTSERRRENVSTSHEDMYSLTVVFRAIAPSVLGTTQSLSTLRLKEAITPDHSRTIGRSFSTSGAQAYAEYVSDTGFLKASFSQKTSEVKAILAYLLTTARASSFTLPTFTGLDYPFGYSRGSGSFSTVAVDINIARANLNRWDLDIDFAEVA